MRILFLAHAFNSLTQRLYVELAALGHEISIEFDVHERLTEEAVAAWRPELIVAPYLRRAIPESVWRRHRCLVVHPGVVGDRGPSALDWAIALGERRWGVTVLQANAQMDGGDVWSSAEFDVRDASKGALYRREVADAAVRAVLEAVGRATDASFSPTPLDPSAPGVRGTWRGPLRAADRPIDWARDDTASVLRRIRAGDGTPGVLDSLFGEPFHLYDAHPEGRIRGGPPGAVIARRDHAILRATVDAAVWIGHLKRPAGADPDFKLPAATLLGARLDGVPEAPMAPEERPGHDTWREIVYEESDAVGWLRFSFYNGAMGVAQCERLRAALARARERPTRVIVLLGGPDFWSNGLHLNLIEASAHPAQASWDNIEAMNDLALELITVERQFTIAALDGNAGAGGVFLALAADRVLARDGIVLNPHYKAMGNLYGSEYWTYLLPRRIGARAAAATTHSRLPVGAAQAAAMGLVDACIAPGTDGFAAEVARAARTLACAPDLESRLDARRAARARDEALRPLRAYRDAELEQMRLNFFGFDPSYHVARSNFVRKVPRARTPSYLAVHRAAGRART